MGAIVLDIRIIRWAAQACLLVRRGEELGLVAGGWQSVQLAGPLAEYAAGFAADLERQDYLPAGVRKLVRLLARLSRWMQKQAVSPTELDAAALKTFVASGAGPWSSGGLGTVLRYLRGLGVVPVPPPRAPGPGEEVLADFARYLSVERALRRNTIAYYVPLTRPFVEAFWDRDRVLGGLRARDVAGYVAARLPSMENGQAKLTVTALRSFLRFAHVKGLVPERLDSLVPAVAGMRKTGLPKQYARSQVQALLDSCDRTRSVGRRDYAMLLVLSRLGLRVSEVAALTLEDLDWQQGTVTVHGKGGQLDVLPVPVDVGTAIVEYLTRGRPTAAAGCRNVFLRARAPHRGLTREGAGRIAVGANRRSGFTGPAGAHRLRHTLASDTLNTGASLEEVGQLLRHRSASSTAIYANLDLKRLRPLARPWPTAAGAR